MEMEPAKGREGEKVEETDQKTDPDLSVTHDDTHELMKPEEESEEKQNATLASTLDIILKSLWKISVFRKELPRFTEDEYVAQLGDFFLNNQTMESNDISKLLINILELLPRWKSGTGEEEPPNSKFEVYELVKKICKRCKMDTEYPVERCYGLIVIANLLREVKSAFEEFTFENILKVIRMDLMPCEKEGCGKRNYVNRMINKSPSVFTIAFEWENNETEGEIVDTTSVLATEIDISAIYKYEGDSLFAKYCLVSMVCLCGDQYNCIAYENNRWIRYFDSKKEVTGDWNSVLSSCVKLKIRPEILFYENVIGRSQIVRTDQIVFGSLGEISKYQ